MSGPWFGPGARDRPPAQPAEAPRGWLTRPRTVAHQSRPAAQPVRALLADELPAARDPAGPPPGNPLRRLRRALYRTRYPLAPFWAALGVAQVALLLRATMPPSLAVCAVVVLLVAADVAVARASRTLREHRAGILAALAGAAWIGWVLAAGLGRQQLAALVLAALVCAPPWWRSHRVRASRASGKLARAWPWAAARCRLAGVTILATEPGEMDGQWTHRLDLAGHTVDRLLAALPDLESKLKLRRGSLRVEPVHADASRALLHVVARDPLTPADDVPPDEDEGIPWPGPRTRTVRDPWGIGPYEDGPDVEVRMRDAHWLIVGATGAGKGVLADLLIAQADAADDAEPWAVDFKGGRLVAKWGPVIRRSATNARGTEAGLRDARVLLRDLRAEVDRRAAAGADRSADTGLDHHVATPEEPHIVLIVDEAERVLDDPECLAELLELSDVARSEAVTLIIMVKRATNDSLRAGRFATNLQTRIVLGYLANAQDLRAALPGATDLPLESMDRPGKVLVRQGARMRPRPARVWRMTPEQVREIRARREAAPRPFDAPTPDDAEPEGSPAETAPASPAESSWPFPPGAPSPERALGLLEMVGPSGMARADFIAAGWTASTLYEHLQAPRAAGQVVNVARRWYLAGHAPPADR